MARSLTDYEGHLTLARSQLGEEEAFAAAWAEGKAMSLEQAIEYALGTEEPAPPAPRKASGGTPGPLTRREREVAVLAGQELTNRRIAEELSISEHTVANHVRNILKKLGLRSRAQIPSRL